jgi:diacylglycerol kinase (ATP)
MNYKFLINPNSGTRKNTLNLIGKIDRRLRAAGHNCEFCYTAGPGDATVLARQAAGEKFDAIVAIGGDGTVNETASGLTGSESALAIIPMGSGNGVARSLNIPLGIERNLDLLSDPEFDHIDCGEINGKYFFGISGIGFDARIGLKFQHFGLRGPIPYFIIGVREFLQYIPQKITIATDDRKIEADPLILAIANTTQYGNGAIIAPMADPRDGRFDICILNRVSLVRSVSMLRKLFSGTIDKSENYDHFKAGDLIITSAAKEIIAHLDGEPHVFAGELRIKLHPGALKVITGKHQDPHSNKPGD